MRKLIGFLCVILLSAVILLPQSNNIVGGIPVNSIVQSAYTNATTTFSNVPGLSFSASARTSYIGTCYILWQASAVTGGPQFQWTGPASPTAVSSSMKSDVTLSTVISAHSTAFSSAMANTGVVTSATNQMALVMLGIVNGANQGTVQLQAAANGVGTLTIQPGSFCVFQ
jgi:hypothetical protein